MRLYAAKRRLPRFLPAAALAASLLLAAAYLAGRTDRSADEQARQAAEDSIRLSTFLSSLHKRNNRVFLRERCCFPSRFRSCFRR